MLEQTGAEWAPCVIVGNKSDLNTTRLALPFLSFLRRNHLFSRSLSLGAAVRMET
jgi:hypothetical protein